MDKSTLQPDLLYICHKFGSICSSPKSRDQFIALATILFTMTGQMSPPLAEYTGLRIYVLITDCLTDQLQESDFSSANCQNSF